VLFLGFQGFEYSHTTFSIADRIYGSVFFVATGFHGLHVLIGTIFLIVCAIRI
jgi:heme/copper-type cytochrome/quinol oxidase subunit 3